MATRASSRVYNPFALEIWFSNVMAGWESYFAEADLDLGRELYREGKISGLELSEKDAIVHCTFARKDTCYSVIEWVDGRPQVRASTDDQATGRAVAVAGLYEIEELIADEIEPLPYEPKKKPRPEAESRPQRKEPKPAPERPARKFRLKVEGVRAGLRLTAQWLHLDGTRETAFREDAGRLPSAERELLVRLTGMAKESGFVFRPGSHDFLLSDVERIPPFFSHARPRWEQRFGPVELDLEARHMAEGVRAVSIIGEAQSAGGANMRLNWRFRLGDRWLDPEDAERLARAGRGTHVIRGLGLVRIAEEQSGALADWRVAAANGSVEAQTWPRYMVFSLFGDRGAELDLKGELKEWRDSLGQRAEDAPEQKRLPDFLRPYQAHGVRWMANLREHDCHGLLADEMGLGKTLQVLTLLSRFPVTGQNSLIVCPASVVPVWQSEAAHWYPDLETAVLSSRESFEQPDLFRKPKLWIASYTQLRRHKHLLDDAEFGYAVLDEAQQIKNPDAKVTHACCAIRAQCRIALTGTPLENRMLDLWTIFRFLMPGLLGSRRRFEDMAEHRDAELRGAFEERLRSQIAPFVLRREKDSVGTDLPDKVEMDLICPITDIQRQAYESLLARGKEELGQDLQAAMKHQSMHFFSLLTRLRQVCCDPGLIPDVDAELDQSGKIQALLTHLEEALEGKGTRKVVIFSQFVKLLKRLKPLIRREFPKLSVMELTGETKDRAKPVREFQENEGPAVILVSLRAGGTGITLHAADYVFLLDPWWNPAVENQAVDRVHRIGQRHRVFVYRMITQGTIEERIQHLKKEKRELFENTLGSLGGASDLLEHFGDIEELAKLLDA
ncbi:DEAD/DEAH box helicase [Coraliomargarita parva]|uniref:DEAD/DEAH box helicase n=1 Tax=Coraliomargarita parva TaxID=3014050 RepID=UPI0022B4BC59|nr:DEAD/DEAH box helicase [Coraliomargarita parva]